MTPRPANIIAGALDDAELVGHTDRPTQADTILAALARFGYHLQELP